MIVYVLEATTLCGGVKVVFEHVRELNKAGMKAVVASIDDYPRWLYFDVPFFSFENYREIFSFPDFSSGRFVLTFYKQILIADKLNILNRCFHFCQGYEGAVEEAQPFIYEIASGYNICVPGFTVSERLSKYINSMFPDKNLCNVGQAIDHEIFYHSKNAELAPLFRVMLMGSFYNSVKEVKKGLKALNLLKGKLPIHIIRVSLSDTLKDEEKIASGIQEYYYLLKPDEVGDVMRSCHGILIPSNNAEGFGLPVVEAMACGLPSVITKTDSFMAIDPSMKSAIFVDIADEIQMADAMFKLLTNSEFYFKIRSEGLKTASKYNYKNVVKKLGMLFGDNS